MRILCPKTILETCLFIFVPTLAFNYIWNIRHLNLFILIQYSICFAVTFQLILDCRIRSVGLAQSQGLFWNIFLFDIPDTCSAHHKSLQ